MSQDYSAQIEQIKKATTLEEIKAIARQFSAKSIGEGGILYSRDIPNLPNMVVYGLI
jgi:hypothetical protein